MKVSGAVRAARVVALVACLGGCGLWHIPYRTPLVLWYGTPDEIRAAGRKDAERDIAAGHPRVALAGTEDGAQPLGVPDEALPLVARLRKIELPSGCTNPLAGEAMTYARAYNAVLVAYLRASGALQPRVALPPEATRARIAARGPSCPATVPVRPKLCIAQLHVAVEDDACRVAKAELAFWTANKFYLAGSCIDLPTFMPSPGVTCTVALTTCTDGVLGFVVTTATGNVNSPFRRCDFDACSTATNQLSCSERMLQNPSFQRVRPLP